MNLVTDSSATLAFRRKIAAFAGIVLEIRGSLPDAGYPAAPTQHSEPDQFMKRLLKSLFGKPANDGPQVANAMDVNQVLSRPRASTPPVLRAAKPLPGRAKLPTATTERPSTPELDFGADELSMEKPADAGFNPYDTGRFSAAELWDKRHRDGVD